MNEEPQTREEFVHGAPAHQGGGGLVSATELYWPATHTPDEVVCVDLFCGAGGLTQGLESAGVRVVAGVDLDDACRYPYEANNDARFYLRDVADLKPEEVRGWLGGANVRMLAGCAPCQPFSTYALRYTKPESNQNDDRYRDRVGQWALLGHFARLVKGILPDIVVMENVPEVTKHQVFRDFVSILDRLEYSVWYNIVDSSEYGLPQRRRRTVLLASRLGELRLKAPDRAEQCTVKDVLSNLPPLSHGGRDPQDPLHTASRLSDLNLRRIRASAPGGTWRDWPEDLVAACHKKKSGKTYPGVYGRMVWDDMAPTLTTQFYGFGNGRFGHPDQDRAISLREGAILQGFPRDYSFVPPQGKIHIKTQGRLIGNAVPVTLGRAIGKSIVDHVARSAEEKE